MTSLNNATKSSSIKAADLGESGSGKTGILGYLANAGFKLRIADFDSGTAILADPSIVKPESRANIESILTFPVNEIESWANFTKSLNKWEDEGTDFGAIESWGADTVLVLDSASLMTRCALRQSLKESGKSPDAATFDQAIYGILANKVYPVMARILSNKIKCHVVANFHVRFRENDQGVQKGVFSTEGSKLSTDLPKLFNNVWLVEKGKGEAPKLTTRPTRLFGLKCSMPSVIAAEEDPADLGSIFQRMIAAAEVAPETLTKENA